MSTDRRSWIQPLFCAVSLCVSANAALAQSEAAPTPQAPAESPATAPTAAAPDTSVSTRPAWELPNGPEVDRSFLFIDDPTLPAPGHAIVSLGMGNVTRTGEERPIGSGDISPQIMGEVGIFNRLSVYANMGVVFWQANNPNAQNIDQTGTKSPVTLDTGVRILLTNPTSKTWIWTAVPAYGLDDGGNNVLQLTTTLAWAYDIFRAAATFNISHTFQSDADAADLMAAIGGNVKLPLGFRVGVEGVITDLEEIATPGAEGGSSGYAGPTAGWEWNRFQIVAGPAYGGGPNYQGFMGRATASLKF